MKLSNKEIEALVRALSVLDNAKFASEQEQELWDGLITVSLKLCNELIRRRAIEDSGEVV